jgi:hypothetical protein
VALFLRPLRPYGNQAFKRRRNHTERWVVNAIQLRLHFIYLKISEKSDKNRMLDQHACLQVIHVKRSSLEFLTWLQFPSIPCGNTRQVIVVSLIFKMAYLLSWPVQELLKKARVRCAIANSKIFAKTFNIFIRAIEATIFISDTTITTMQSATKT